MCIYEMWAQIGIRRYALRPRFESQPPEDLRKSNFFNFRVELRAEDALVDIVGAQFQRYLNEDQGGDPNLRNGIKYSIAVKYPNGTTERKELYLMLVDAATHEPIRYEGHDANPRMQRVLLTHETICTRCSLNKSCGNKNEAPSDPGIVSRGLLKFFLKCNQNCLKGAGNPRDMRRFALAVSFDDMSFDKSKILAVSTQMFVHNNSKHSRKRKREEEAASRDHRRLNIFHLAPSSNKVTIVGENLQQDTLVFIDNALAVSRFLSDHVMDAWVPPNNIASTCKVTLQQGEHFLEAGTFDNENAFIPGQIAFVSPAFGGAVREFDFISTRWAIPRVTFMVGDLQLPVLTLIRNVVMKVGMPRELPPGIARIRVLWNGAAQFDFPYRIRDRHEVSADPNGYLCLYRKGWSAHEMDAERPNIAVAVQEFDGEPFDPENEWDTYIRAVRYYETERSYSSSSSDGLHHHLSCSDASSPI